MMEMNAFTTTSLTSMSLSVAPLLARPIFVVKARLSLRMGASLSPPSLLVDNLVLLKSSQSALPHPSHLIGDLALQLYQSDHPLPSAPLEDRVHHET